MDETYLKVNGCWCYVYRAIDRDGNLVDVMLSQTRDMVAAQAFFQQVVAATGRSPERVTTDGPTAYPRAVREVLGEDVQHRTSRIIGRSSSADAGRRFRYDLSLGKTGGYLYRLDTQALAPGMYDLLFTAGRDPIVHAAPFQVP